MGCVGHGEGLGAHSECNEKLLEGFNKGRHKLFSFSKNYSG